MSFRLFPWVPDGIWDYQDFLVRYQIVEGKVKHVIAKSWVDKGGPPMVSSELKQPWGTYPTFPPKPPKGS